MPRTPVKPALPVRKRPVKAKAKDLTTETIPTLALPEIPCAVHLEVKMTWLGITVTKVTKPLIKP